MSNYNILEKFLKIQENTLVSKLILLNFAKIIYNELDPSFYWNFALIDQPIDKNKINKIEKTLKFFDRKPAIYFENTNFFVPFIEVLEKDGYRLNSEDSWMFYEEEVPKGLNFNEIKRVESVEDLNVWLETLDKCYNDNDLQNPYGELGNYFDLAERAWKKNNSIGKFEYFIAFKELIPVAVATLTYEENLGYISNVGSIQEVRGQGYGKLITLFCVNEAKRLNIEQVCLATEDGTYPNKFYKKIGFKTRFMARYYVKE
ncbi:MAG: GNAT family N-acetyltransferase [Candidatus Paceibacterota bacterium]